jgi:hypothetical protein
VGVVVIPGRLAQGGVFFMKLGIIGSPDITLFNPILYFQLKEPNFQRFCAEKGFKKRKVSEIVTSSLDGADAAARNWATLLGFNLITFTPEDNSPPALLACSREIIDHSDIILFIQDSTTDDLAAILNYAAQQKKPHYLIYEFSFA